MRIDAKSIEEFVEKSGSQKDKLLRLDQLISEMVPDLNRSLFISKSIVMISYGEFPYKKATWPLIGIAPQKGTVNLYISGVRNNQYIAESYKDKLGKVSVGKGCIRINKLENLNFGRTSHMLIEAQQWLESLE